MGGPAALKSDPSGKWSIQNPTDLSYGQFKLLPYWDSLRGDPRFEKIFSTRLAKLL